MLEEVVPTPPPPGRGGGGGACQTPVPWRDSVCDDDGLLGWEWKSLGILQDEEELGLAWENSLCCVSEDSVWEVADASQEFKP